MAGSKYQRPSPDTRKQAGATTPSTDTPSTEAAGSGEVMVSKIPIAIIATMTAAAGGTTVPVVETPITVAPITPTLTKGAKRRRNNEDENDEDAFYGRKSAKKIKSKELDIEDKGSRKKQNGNGNGRELTTPKKASEITPEFRKRLKFDPEIHGVGLEARFLRLKEDMFEKLVSPRKKAGAEDPNVGEAGTGLGECLKGHSATSPRKIAKHKSIKKIPLKASGAKIGEQILQSKHISDPQQKPAQEASVNKQTTTPIPIPPSLTLEKRLQRLTPTPTTSKPASTIRNISPIRSRTVWNAFAGPQSPVKSSKPLTKPSFALPGDAHMKKRAVEREERKKRMEEAEKQKEETKKQQQLYERFKTHTEQRLTKKDQQQGLSVKVPTVPHALAVTTVQTPHLSSTTPKDLATSTTAVPTAAKPTQPPISRRITLDEVNQQLSNENELEEKKKAEEAVLRLRREAAEKGKESARLWAEQMKSKSVKN